MPFADFRNTYSWQEAIELGPQLVALTEQLPAVEQMGLSYQLHQAMVDLPTAIGQDLLDSNSHARNTAVLRLSAALDLIENVYPALDATDVRAAVDNLADRLSSDRFAEQTPGAARAYQPPAATPVAAQAEAAAPALANPAVLVDAAASERVSVPVQPTAEPVALDAAHVDVEG